MKLREHQILAVEMLRESFKRHKRTILNAGTGFGKSITAVFIGVETVKRGNNIIFLVHRKEILQQFFKTFKWFGVTPSLIIPGKKHTPNQPVYLGMVETYRRRMKQPGFIESLNAPLLICDEVHWGSYESVVNCFPGRVIGLSATPKAASGQDLNKYFDDCVCPVSVPELINQGYLMPGMTFSIEHDFSKLKLKGKDFNAEDLYQEFKSPTLFEGCLEEYEKHCKDKKAIVYSVNVQHSIETCEMFTEAGYQCWHVDATSTHRNEIFEAFAESKKGILFNVGIATTGYDEPSVECIIENFATAQLTKHHQVVGRGARPCEEIDKKQFHIIDMGRNYMRHGLYGEDIDWIEIFNNPKLAKSKKEEKEASNTECRLCGALIKITMKACPYCLTPVTEKQVEDAIMEKGDTKQIKEYRLQNMPPDLRGMKPGHMSYQQLKEYAKHMNYKPGWIGMQMGLRNRYNRK